MLHEANLGFRNISKVMKLFFRNGKIERAPSHETCIQWEIKVGYHKLVSHRKREDGEWLWIADHAVKAGVFKCLAIVGIRMDQISTMNDLTLSLNDVTALAIVPMKVSNGTTVQDEFNKLAKSRYGIDIDTNRIRKAISFALKDGRFKDRVTVEDVKRLKTEVN